MKARIAAFMCVVAFGCGGSDSPSQNQSQPPAGPAVSGTMTFDRVPPSANGLDYGATVQEPVRGAKVEILDGATDSVVATAVTDDAGHYSASWSTPAAVRVRVRAETATPSIRVQDNTDGGALWAMVSGLVDASTAANVSLNAPSGWTGTAYGGERVAAPFAILDTAYTAARAFLAERSVSFPPLGINWSPDNRPESGDPSSGQIGITHWDGSELYILGKADVDTDEFDAMVLAHEWGHYFESKLSRSDTPGGMHSLGDYEDPRLAWGEGWATGLAAIVLQPETRYADTSGERQAKTGTYYDIEDNGAANPRPGWYSEASVLHLFYDLWDRGTAEPFDAVSLPLGALYDTLVGAQRTTPAFTTVFSFVDALKRANPSQAGAIDALLAHEKIAPVQDAYGTGETNDAGYAPVLPVHNRITIGGAPTILWFLSEAEEHVTNSLRSNRLATFEGDGRPVTITLSSPALVGLRLYENGTRVVSADNSKGDATVTGTTTAGAHYGIVAIGASTASPQIEYPALLKVTSP